MRVPVTEPCPPRDTPGLFVGPLDDAEASCCLLEEQEIASVDEGPVGDPPRALTADEDPSEPPTRECFYLVTVLYE